MPVITGTGRADTLAATADGQTVRGLGSGDTLTSGFNDTRLVGDSGNDKLATDLELDEWDTTPVKGRLSGGGGADELTAKLTVYGRQIDSTLVLDGGAGDDVITAVIDFHDEFYGGKATTTIRGGAGDDIITANLEVSGNEFGDLAAAGVNDVSGGLGDDTITVSARGSHTGQDSNVTNIVSGGDGQDKISAEAVALGNGAYLARNEISGGGGDDTITATAGASSNSGGETAQNLVFGGAGNDTIDVSTSAGWGFGYLTVTVSGGGGNDRITALTSGGNYGMEAASRLSGGAGNDTIKSTMENPTIGDSSPYAFDKLSNRVDGGAGNDTLLAEILLPNEYTEPRESVSAVNRVSGGSGDDSLTAKVEGIGRSMLDGGSGRDVLRVEGGEDNVLSGGGGADRLFAGSGSERMSGGGGVDDFVFDVGSNQATDRLVDFDADADRLCFIGITDSGAKGLADDLDAMLTIVDHGVGKDVELRFDSGSVVVFEGAGLGTRPWYGTPVIDSIADLVADPARQLQVELV